MLTTLKLQQILETLPMRTIGLVGDLFLDRYLDIAAELNEPSIETGLTAYQVVRVRNYPGALGTVLNNLVALGVGGVELVSLIGEDGEGFDLRKELAKMPTVQLDGLLSTSQMRTPTYTKPMLCTASERQELNRLDIKNRSQTPHELEQQLLERICQSWARWDAVLILDQVSERNCGVVTDRIREELEQVARQSPKVLVLADSRERIHEFQHVAIKPNSVESQQIPLRQHQIRFITHGERGMEVWRPGSVESVNVPAYPVTGPIDTCGAGDSCSAALACAMVSGCSFEEAATFANLVASITIQQIGVTGTATPTQVLQRWQQLGLD